MVSAIILLLGLVIPCVVACVFLMAFAGLKELDELTVRTTGPRE